MHIRCPHCNNIDEIPLMMEGVTTKCRRCGKIFSYRRTLRARPRAPRAPANIPCTVAGVPGRVINASKSGLLIRVKGFLAAPGEIFRIELHLPTRQKPVRVEAAIARIVDRKSSRFAFRIISMTDREGYHRFLRLRGEASRIAAMVSS